MSDSTIGIKLANGTYYPILKDGMVSKKKLVLTTVKDNQESVQIDLYKGSGEEINDAVYIGSLVIEEIEEAESGAPDIELVIGMDEEGNLHATANDAVTGESQSLSVGLQTLDDQSVYEVPEFDLDMDDNIESGMDDSMEDESPAEDDEALDSEGFDEDDSLEARYGDFPEDDKKNDRGDDGPGILMRILFVVLALAAIGLLILFLMRLFNGPAVPPLQAKEDQTAEIAQQPEEPAAEPEPVKEEPAAAAEPAAPAVSEAEAVQPLISGEARDAEMASITGIWYKIKRGDTLWDLSSSFYENPWLFPELADENDIPDPDLILEGNDLYIPNPRQ
ncbi:MAG: Hsp70 family protein [Spirochaetales bacterium]|nr:Hsp70 family protein [Spirochaetales bacterium]